MSGPCRHRPSGASGYRFRDMAGPGLSTFYVIAACLLLWPVAIHCQSPAVNTQLFVDPTFAGGQVLPHCACLQHTAYVCDQSAGPGYLGYSGQLASAVRAAATRVDVPTCEVVCREWRYGQASSCGLSDT